MPLFRHPTQADTSDDHPPRARTQADVARYFQVERSTVHDWSRKGMPGKPGAYPLDDIARWRKAREDDTVLLAGGGNSPWLEELRKNKALQEQIRLAEMRREVVAIDHMRDALGIWASIIRRLGERLGQRFGPDAIAMVTDALDDCARALTDVITSDTDTPTDGHPVPTAERAPKRAAPARTRKRATRGTKADQPVGRKRARAPKRTIQR